MKIASKLIVNLCATVSSCYASASAAQNSSNQIYSQIMNSHFLGGNTDDGFYLLITSIILLVLTNLFFAYESHRTLKRLNSLYPYLCSE